MSNEISVKNMLVLYRKHLMLDANASVRAEYYQIPQRRRAKNRAKAEAAYDAFSEMYHKLINEQGYDPKALLKITETVYTERYRAVDRMLSDRWSRRQPLQA